MHAVRRRQFLTTAGALLAAPASLVAQQPDRVVRIGFLYFGSQRTAQQTGRYEAFVQGLRQLGHVQGRNFSIEQRFADGSSDRVAALAAELARLKPDVIVATGSPAYQALRDTGTTIPIVVTVTVDPVAAGLAATLARPGGNFTGLTDTAEFLGPKQLELLSAAVPRLSRVAVLSNPDNSSHASQLVTVRSEAQRIGKQVLPVQARTAKDIEAAFATMARQQAGAVIILSDTFFVDQLRAIADLAR